jgi:hypothetical protein
VNQTITTPHGIKVRSQSVRRYILILEWDRTGRGDYKAEVDKRTDNFETAKKWRGGRYSDHLIWDSRDQRFRLPEQQG